MGLGDKETVRLGLQILKAYFKPKLQTLPIGDEMRGAGQSEAYQRCWCSGTFFVTGKLRVGDPHKRRLLNSIVEEKASEKYCK